VHLIDAKSPLQNGPTERVGGIFKEFIEKTILEASIIDEEGYKQAAATTLAARNARADCSGFRQTKERLVAAFACQAIFYPMTKSTEISWLIKHRTVSSVSGRSRIARSFTRSDQW